MKGEGAGAPPGAVTVPFGDPGTPCTPVGAVAKLVDTEEERLLATLAVAVASADCTDPLNALLASYRGPQSWTASSLTAVDGANCQSVRY